MRSLALALLMCSAFQLAASGQSSTNAPATEIENFELQTDTVIVKGFGDIGSVNTDAGVVTVRCKESDNSFTSRKEYGLAVDFVSSQSGGGYLVVDYDELDALIRGLDFLSKVSYNITPMPAFNASFTTKSGFRVGAHSERRQGSIELYLQLGNSPRITLTPDQFTQFQNLIGQAKNSLDVTRSKASSP